MRITVDLTKASTEIVDLSSKLNPRVGDGGLALPFHVLYDDNVVDMHDKDIEFISQDPDGHDIYVSGTVDTSTPGDNAYQGDVTFKFPNGTFKKAGTYDTNKTMFRIVNKSDNSVISTVNVKLTVLDDGSTEFNFDPTKTGYNSRMEDMLNDFKEEHDKKIASINQEGQQAADDAKAKAEATLNDVKDKAKQSLADITSQAQQSLNEIKQLSNEAKGNVAGDTAATAKQAKEQAIMNAGLLHDHDEEISAARGRYMKLADRENAQDDEINRKEDRQNANANYASLQQKDAQQDTIIAKKAGKLELEAKLAQMDIHPEVFENSAALQAKYPNGAPGMMVTADTEHKYIYLNNQWEDKGPFVFNDLNPKDKELLYKRSSNNILVNPDLIDNAEGWGITSGWEEDPAHSIGKSMAYGCLLTEDPQKEISIYQEGIPVKGKQKLSMGVQVIADNTGTAKMQVIFRDENDSIIENSSAGVIFSTIEKRGQQKKVENINIPDEAVTAAFTISTSSKGLVIICRPQINFGEKLIPYSILEMNNERIDVNNILVNPDLIDNAEGWGIASDWVEDPTHSIGKSMAYSCSLAEDPKKDISIYQEGISVKGKQKLSMGVQVIADNTGTAKMQVIFRDENDSIIENSAAGVIFSTIEKRGRQKKVENINIPDNAATADFTISTSSKGLVIICRPQINFGEKLIPYSTLEINNERTDVNNILVNPDLIDDAEGWAITSGWEEDPAHSIGKSMAYGCLLTEDPQKDISIYQEGIPVKGKQKLSMGVQVIADNTGTAKMQVIFRDENDSIIENSSTGVIFSTIEKRGRQKKVENINIPDNAATADFTISTSSKGLVIICRPQINFGEKLIPYSTLEINNERIDVDNILVNPDLIDDAEGWAITSGWEEDPAHSIGKSMAYGCSRDEKSTEKTIIYQKDISVINRTVLSAAVEAITTSNDCRAGLQIIFRNSQGEVLADGMHSLEFSHTLNGFEKFKIENIKIPDNAVTAAFTISFEGTGVVIICRPQIVFNEKIIPYSLSEITTEQQNKANSVLPQFNIGISRESIGDKWVKSSFSFQQNGREIKGFIQIAIQGDSSRFHDKKNYKIKVFSDEDCKQKLKLRLMPSWPETNKFNLKANFIDATQSRNLASAKLVATATSVTPIADKIVESNLAKTSNFGQMEGFPIEIWLNGAYNGLYTCNTKKDDVVFGLDANEKGNAAISVLDNVAAPSSQLLKDPTAKLDNVAYADELHDTPDPELVANWSKWLDFLNNSSDEDFKNKLPSYIDVKSAINLYLFGVMSREYDYCSKSVLYLTWNNGKYFYLIPYDLDSNWGQTADGKIEGNPTDDTNWGFATENSTKVDGKFVSNANWNKLFERLYKLFMPEIKEQYTYLRSNVWQTDRLLNAYRDFMNGIPQEAYQKDQELWPQIPSVTTNTYEQLHQVIVQRSNQMDKWIKTK